ncbi:SMP-30/gluconolactonase/LRE family protein [Nocardia sp. BMG111209]|uniref:SMP-30/gluconolactonase/LRE family protein n=1 Tax=Nocardia sp. BMG111209 TaxID=1160137 RepID=UPI000561A1E0|nr:SMP-30/gluconolactonase/LRE family protein [Nocardia sp. BMG111209]
MLFGSGWGRGRLRAGWVAVLVAAGMIDVAAQAQAAPAGDCSAGWQSTTLLSGHRELENLDSDGHGGFFVSALVAGELLHLRSGGETDTLATGLDHPGGVRFDGRYVYFSTGDNFPGPPGALHRYDTATGEFTDLLGGLDMPNGLLRLPDGDLLIASSAPGSAQGISRYRPSSGEFTPGWSDLALPNGLALSGDGTAVYATTLTAQIYRVPLEDPHHPTVVLGAPALAALPDDLDATRSGPVYFADQVAGAVYRADPATGAVCSVVTGLITPNPVRQVPDGVSSVRIERDGDGWSLYVTAMDGALRRLRPPPGVDLTPPNPDMR